MTGCVVLIYSRPGCHLCEDLVDALLPIVRDEATVEVRNIDTRPDWQSKYGTRIPVVEVDGRLVCQYRLDAPAIRRALAAGKAAMAAS